MVSMDDSANEQRILRHLVEREVYYCVSYLVSEIASLVYANGGTESITEEDIIDLMRRPASAEDACFESGYRVVEDANGDWWWYCATDFERTPFDNDPPNDVDIEHMDHGGWECDGMDFDTRQEAVEAAWQAALGGTACDTEEEAYEECIDMNRIDVHDFEAEVYEHWIVSSWFARRLKEYGETVVDLAGCDVWGRTCTGQGIMLDRVIRDIAADMEILPGQRYEWKDT